MENLGNSEGVSEVARLRAQIAAEYEAAQNGLNGIAETARHEFISQKYAALDTHFNALCQLMPEEEALQVMIDANDAVFQQKNAAQATGQLAVGTTLEQPE